MTDRDDRPAAQLQRAITLLEAAEMAGDGPYGEAVAALRVALGVGAQPTCGCGEPAVWAADHPLFPGERFDDICEACHDPGSALSASGYVAKHRWRRLATER